MTVAELIERLGEFPPDLPVMAMDSEHPPYDVTKAYVDDPWGYPAVVIE